jgi:hypothetical protein
MVIWQAPVLKPELLNSLDPRGCKANPHTAVDDQANLPSRRLGQLVPETPFGPKSPNPTRHFQAPRNVTCHVTCRRGLDYWWLKR